MATQSSSSTEGLKKLEAQITCPICLDHPLDNPRMLPCFHSFCLHCLQGVPTDLVNGNHYLPCPTCRLSCPVPDKGLATLPPSFVINNLIEVYSLLKKVSTDDQHTSCDNCDNTNNADRYCKQCAKFFCPQCLHHHDNWKPNAGHQTISLEEVASTVYQLPHAKPEVTINCTDHNKPPEIFCETCQELICHNCTVKKHKDHDYDVVSDTYSKHRDGIVKSSLQPLNHQIDRLTEAMAILVSRRDEVTQQAETTKGEIEHTITEIKSRLDEMERKLKEDVDIALKHKVSVLDQQIKEVNTTLGEVTECRDHVEQCVKVGTPHQVLSTKAQMMNRTKSVINNVKDKAFEPLEEAEIKLVKSVDKINEIHNNIGTVQYTSGISTATVSSVSYRCTPLVNHQSAITITVSLPDGLPPPVSLSAIKCHLTPPPDNGGQQCIVNDSTQSGQPIQCIVKDSTQSGQYNVVFTPVTRGRHQLHVTIHDNKIVSATTGSPVNVLVSVPLEMRSKPFKTITRLKIPRGIAVTDNGQLIVSSSFSITILDEEGKKIRSFGSKIFEIGHQVYPRGVAITSKGTILVVDCDNHRIQEYTMKGECISCVGTEGNGPLQFSYPIGITVNKSTGQVFVVDRDNHRVQVLNPDLTFSDMFGSKGSEPGQLQYPHDVAIDSKGFVYITDHENNRIQKFTSEGQFVSSITTQDTNPGQLNGPSGITIDDYDLLYVNNAKEYITVLTTSGEYAGHIGTYKDGCSLFKGIFYNNGVLYVCCSDKIEMFH